MKDLYTVVLEQIIYSRDRTQKVLMIEIKNKKWMRLSDLSTFTCCLGGSELEIKNSIDTLITQLKRHVMDYMVCKNKQFF